MGQVYDKKAVYHYDLKEAIGNAYQKAEIDRVGPVAHNCDMVKIHYLRLDQSWSKTQTAAFLEQTSLDQIAWDILEPDEDHIWLKDEVKEEFASFIPLGRATPSDLKPSQSTPDKKEEVIFEVFGQGVETGRDAWVTNFRQADLINHSQALIETYNQAVARWHSLTESKPTIDAFIAAQQDMIPWSRRLKLNLKGRKDAAYDQAKLRPYLYRPFIQKHIFFDRLLNENRDQFPKIFPTPPTEVENRVICLTDQGAKQPFMVFMTNHLVDLHFVGPRAKTLCFPCYIYNTAGTRRRHNITNWVWQQFQAHYADKSISKGHIFRYIYAILHHPHYRERYAHCLRQHIPHIPFAAEFWPFVQAGIDLAELHIHYEEKESYPLERVETQDASSDWRVKKMILSQDKTSLVYNPSLTLRGIPPETFAYQLGHQSALEWLIAHYQVKTDRWSGIMDDPNDLEDEDYILRLIGKVITVSLETMNIVWGLPEI